VNWFTVLMTAVFFTLKVTGVIAWSWAWVFAPLWIGLGLALLVIFIGLAVMGIAAKNVAKSELRPFPPSSLYN
jgi:Transmembrane Fragile-X-F protein